MCLFLDSLLEVRRAWWWARLGYLTCELYDVLKNTAGLPPSLLHATQNSQQGLHGMASDQTLQKHRISSWVGREAGVLGTESSFRGLIMSGNRGTSFFWGSLTRQNPDRGCTGLRLWPRGPFPTRAPSQFQGILMKTEFSNSTENERVNKPNLRRKKPAIRNKICITCSQPLPRPTATEETNWH